MADILDRLKSWRDQIVEDKSQRYAAGALPEIEINYLTRAITEI